MAEPIDVPMNWGCPASGKPASRRGVIATLVASPLLASAAWAHAAPAAGRGYALLVGVGEVASLPRRLLLRGPDNDVALMREALLARGFSPAHIAVLARRARPSSGPPTHSAVRAAMADMVPRVNAGDVVLLHLAGHGVQVPQPPGALHPEPDGLDEVFLLEDTRPWEPTQQRLPNALLDDDIGDWIDTLVDRGARVVAIFDTCHAGGMARERTGPARWRSMAGAELGIPSREAPSRIRATAESPSRGAAALRADGRVLAYAARSHELAGEEWLPRGGGLTGTRMHGVFSFALAQALMGRVSTVQDLRATLRQRYSQEGRTAPTPQIIGQGQLLP